MSCSWVPPLPTKYIKVHLYEYAILERRTTQISTKDINPKQTHDYEYPVQNMWWTIEMKMVWNMKSWSQYHTFFTLSHTHGHHQLQVIYTCNPGGIVFFRSASCKTFHQPSWWLVEVVISDPMASCAFADCRCICCFTMWKRNSNRPKKKKGREREEAMVVIVADVRQNKRTALP